MPNYKITRQPRAFIGLAGLIGLALISVISFAFKIEQKASAQNDSVDRVEGEMPMRKRRPVLDRRPDEEPRREIAAGPVEKELSPEAITQISKIIAADGVAGDNMGFSVDVSGDTAVIGAPGHDQPSANDGAVYIFVRSGVTTWTLQQKITGPANDPLTYLFGSEVSISGNTVAISNWGTDVDSDPAKIHIYTRDGSYWSFQQTLQNENAYAAFGNDIDLEGDTLVAGADSENIGGGAGGGGAAYIYVRSSGVWTLQQRLLPTTPPNFPWFGVSVALSGDTLAVGADGNSSTQGKVYVFKRTGTTWTPEQILSASDPDTSDQFGFSVGLDGDTLVAGSPKWDQSFNEGAAYIFTRSGGAWTQQQRLVASDRQPSDYFGWTVDIDANRVIVNSQVVETATPGCVYVFDRVMTTWSQTVRLVGSDTAPLDELGSSAMAIDGQLIIAGARSHDAGGTNRGAAYVFSDGTPPAPSPTPVITPTPSPTPTPAPPVGPFSVGNTNDSGPGSLRQAILDANAVAGTDTITFDPMAFRGAGNTITLPSGFIYISESLSLVGPGSTQLTIDAENARRIFVTKDGTSVSISGITLTRGAGGPGINPGRGGAMLVQGDLSLTDVIISNSFAPSAGGGLFLNANDDLTLNACRITGNTAGNYGGGLSTEFNSILTIDRSTFAGNTAQASTSQFGGGGMYIGSNTFTMTNSTVSGNAANWHGGGIWFDYGGVKVISNSTISGNTTTLSGGGIFLNQGGANVNTTISYSTIVSNSTTGNSGGGGVRALTIGALDNTIVANNTINAGTGPDYNGLLTSNGYNLIENTAGATITGNTATNITGVDPNLNALGNYGGPTQTHALLPGSPAVDAADPGMPPTLSKGGEMVFVEAMFPATDQRGISRPIDGDSNGSALPDIGAFELQVLTASEVTVSGRIFTNEGRGLTNAHVMITDETGATQTVVTGRSGIYRFDGIETGHTYIISVSARRFNYSPQIVVINDNVSDLNFLPDQLIK